MSTVLVALDGVVRTPAKARIPAGVRLIDALAKVFRVVLVLDDNEVEQSRMWLQMESIRSYQDIMPALLPTELRGDDARVAQVKHLRGRGDPLEMVVDADPDRIAAVFHVGVTGLLFAHPGILRPEFRPDFDGTPRPWAELVEEIERGRYFASQLSTDEPDGDD